MSFLPGSLTPALLRSYHRKVISHSDGHSVIGCRKTKRADYTEHQKSAGAWLSLQSDVLCNRLWKFKVGFCFLPAPANRTKGVVEQFGASGMPIPCRMKPTYGGTLVFSCLCSGSPLCHHYTDTSLIRQVSECLSLYSEFQRAVFNGNEKRSLYWLGHLEAIYQRVLEKILKTPSYTSRRNIQIRTLLNIFFDPVF